MSNTMIFLNYIYIYMYTFNYLPRQLFEQPQLGEIEISSEKINDLMAGLSEENKMQITAILKTSPIKKYQCGSSKCQFINPLDLCLCHITWLCWSSKLHYGLQYEIQHFKYSMCCYRSNSFQSVCACFYIPEAPAQGQQLWSEKHP